jgi:hypothetical protein
VHRQYYTLTTTDTVAPPGNAVCNATTPGVTNDFGTLRCTESHNLFVVNPEGLQQVLEFDFSFSTTAGQNFEGSTEGHNKFIDGAQKDLGITVYCQDLNGETRHTFQVGHNIKMKVGHMLALAGANLDNLHPAAATSATPDQVPYDRMTGVLLSCLLTFKNFGVKEEIAARGKNTWYLHGLVVVLTVSHVGDWTSMGPDLSYVASDTIVPDNTGWPVNSIHSRTVDRYRTGVKMVTR